LSEFPEVHLAERDSNSDAEPDDGAAETTAYISVACDDVPYKRVFQSFTTGEISDTPPKDDPEDEYQDLMQFTKDGIAYLDALSAELGDVPLIQ
jgi:hypothetical protein